MPGDASSSGVAVYPEDVGQAGASSVEVAGPVGADPTVVRLEAASRGLRVSLPMTGRATLFSPVPPHQTILDRYFTVCEGGG